MPRYRNPAFNLEQEEISEEDFMDKMYQNLRERYFSDDLSEDARNLFATEERKRPYQIPNLVGNALTTLGAGLQGKDAAKTAMDLRLADEIRAERNISDWDRKKRGIGADLSMIEKLGGYERGEKKAEREESAYQLSQRELAEEMDPKSEKSRQLGSFLESQLPGFSSEGMSYRQMQAVLPGVETVYKERMGLEQQQAKDLQAMERARIGASSREKAAQIRGEASKEAAKLRLEEQQEREGRTGARLTKGQMLSSKKYKDAQTAESAGRLVTDLLNANVEGNQVSANMIKTKMAKLAGEVGVLTERDVTRYATSPAIGRQVADKWNQWMSGDFSDATTNELKELVRIMNKKARSEMKEVEDEFLSQYSNTYDVSPEEAAKLFGFDARDKENTPKSGPVKMKFPDGNTYEVYPGEIEAARRKGGIIIR